MRVNNIPGVFVPGTIVSIARASLALSCLLAASCGDSNAPATPRTIEVSRVVDGAPHASAHKSDAAERFGIGAALTSAPKSDDIAADVAQARAALTWSTPAGWSELAPTSMRLANFRVGDAGKVECYLTILAGDAGGLAANANRWRAQMALEPYSKAELETLTRLTFFEREAVLVDFSGTWKGMSGASNESDYRLIGLLLNDPTGSAFLKMTGPAAEVALQREAFLALAASFQPKTSATASATSRPDSAAGLDFTIPSGWRRAPERNGRALTLLANESGLECYVTLLAGDGGGELANVNRWRGQLQLEALDANVLAGLPRIPMLGGEALLVEAESAMSGGTQLLGAVLCRPERSVFVKMSGKKEHVDLQRAAFLEFCKSLEHAP